VKLAWSASEEERPMRTVTWGGPFA